MNITKKFAQIIPLVILSIIVGCTDKELDITADDTSSDSDHTHQSGSDSHGHTNHMAHQGVMATLLTGDKKAGVIELKLHDDKGDLELWITRDIGGAVPLDFDLNTVITASFPKLEQKTVKLLIRNNQENEDEDGNATIRQDKTNYFIFPGNTGVDASFLSNKDFASEVVISFSSNGIEYSTAPFELIPHTHSH